MNLALTLPNRDIDRVVEMAWEDRTSFDTIMLQFGLSGQQVIKLMRREMKLLSFKLWQTRARSQNQTSAAYLKFGPQV